MLLTQARQLVDSDPANEEYSTIVKDLEEVGSASQPLSVLLCSLVFKESSFKSRSAHQCLKDGKAYSQTLRIGLSGIGGP